ncbi:MAG: class I SAM-dependent methyltransferase [archaeon]
MLDQSKRYKQFYSEKWLERYSFWHELMDGMIESQVDAIVETVKSMNKPLVRVLDVGCGIGDVTNRALEKLKEVDIELTANDASEEVLEKYKLVNEAYGPKIILKDMERLPEAMESRFDLILFSHSLYGVSLEGLFEKYVEMLNGNGCILIFLTSHDSDTIQISKKFWKRVHKCEHDETLAEDVIDKINHLKLDYSVKEFKQEVNFDKLRKIKSSGIRDLLVPFLFRLQEFSEKNEIGDYMERLSRKKKVYNIIKAITVSARKSSG